MLNIEFRMLNENHLTPSTSHLPRISPRLRLRYAPNFAIPGFVGLCLASSGCASRTPHPSTIFNDFQPSTIFNEARRAVSNEARRAVFNEVRSTISTRGRSPRPGDRVEKQNSVIRLKKEKRTAITIPAHYPQMHTEHSHS